MPIQLGLTRLLNEPGTHHLLRGKRVGLVCHEAAVDERCRHAVDLFLGAQRALDFRLAALFSPQHGFWGQDQDNMVETGHSEWKGGRVHSLYSETRKPTPAMLADLDVVVVDLQDIGTRSGRRTSAGSSRPTSTRRSACRGAPRSCCTEPRARGEPRTRGAKARA